MADISGYTSLLSSAGSAITSHYAGKAREYMAEAQGYQAKTQSILNASAQRSQALIEATNATIQSYSTETQAKSARVQGLAAQNAAKYTNMKLRDNYNAIAAHNAVMAGISGRSSSSGSFKAIAEANRKDFEWDVAWSDMNGQIGKLNTEIAAIGYNHTAKLLTSEADRYMQLGETEAQNSLALGLAGLENAKLSGSVSRNLSDAKAMFQLTDTFSKGMNILANNKAAG